MFKGITTLSFDLDDTLWPVRPVIIAAERELRVWLDEHYPRVYQQLDREKVMQMRRRVVASEPDKIHDLTYLRKRVLMMMAEHVGYDPDMAEAAFDVFDEHRNRVSFYDDALPALKRLSQRFRLVSLSNGNASLVKTGLDDFFHAQVSARDVGHAKPHEAMFRAAERAAGVPASEVLHIGDDPVFDVQGARDAGQKAVWINRKTACWPDHLDEPVEVADLYALSRLLGVAE